MEVFVMDLDELLARYEALGEERDFVAARALFERAAAEREDPVLLNRYGYLLESHGRNELRQAAALYERAIELDPAFDKPHYQLISARAGLREPERVVSLYEQRLAADPTSVREHRFLAQAYLAARDYGKALTIADAGISRAPDDAALVAARGDAEAGLGEVEEALADWRRALELDPEDIGALYSTAFLLEREGRLAASAAAWQEIIDWNDTRALTLESVWPKQELARLRRSPASREGSDDAAS
jgi:tetratricopeptide (TPR) repeat protein